MGLSLPGAYKTVRTQNKAHYNTSLGRARGPRLLPCQRRT